MRTRLSAFFQRDEVLGYVLTIPLIVFAVILMLYPFYSALVLSLQSKLVGQAPKFVGLANYVRLLTADAIFPTVVRNTLVYAVGTVACKLALGLGMALTLNQRFRFRGIARGLMLIPFVTPDLVVALTWRWIFDGTSGVLNYILKILGIIEVYVPWLSLPATGLATVMVANIWRGFPFFGITLLAGLQSISSDLYEAAEIDGASAMGRFRFITLPSLQMVILVTTILSTIWTFNDFVLLWTMTMGGPADKTHILATYAYQLGFKNNQMGYAMAVSIAMVPLLVLLILILTPRIYRED